MGQSEKQIEDSIIYYFNSLNHFDTLYNYKYQEDSVNAINKTILNYLIKICKSQPAILTYDFKTLKNNAYGLNIITSEDKKLRLICWDVGLTGAARSYNSLAIYKAKIGIKTIVWNDDSKREEYEVCSGEYYSDIYTQRTKNNNTVYLVHGISTYAAGLYGKSLGAFSIQGDSLLLTPFFKISKGIVSNFSIGIDQSIEKNKDKSNIDIIYSVDKKTIKVPLITQDDLVTDRYIVYNFDGYKFVYNKTQNK